MMMLTAWLVYCGVIAAVLTAGAFAWELSARWSGRPARWGWLAALAGSVTLPWLLRLVPERAWPDVMPAALHALPTAAVLLEPVGLGVDPAAGGWTLAEYGVAAWLVLSVLMLVYIGGMVVVLAAARRRWRAAELDGGEVWLTRDTGPAALGVRRGMVVLPSWALQLSDNVRSLLLAHEREHVRAGDPRLLFGGLLCVAAMPWNPVVWVQLLRLRNAIELDCDARVLARGADPRAYGTLLLEVGRRRGAMPLVMATFAEPRVFLEERIRRIARWPLERRPGRAAGFAVLALVLFATALSARDPLRPGGGAVEVPPQPAVNVVGVVGDDVAPDVTGAPAAIRIPPAPGSMVSDTPPPARPRVEDGPTFTPMTVRPELRNARDVQQALIASYPPLLRDAGIGGTPVVWFFIDEEGRVAGTRLSRTSGYPALDEAALNVAAVMEFSPALNRDRRVPVWVEIPIVFTARTEADVPQGLQRSEAQLRASLEQRAAAERQRQAELQREGARTDGPQLANLAEVQRALVRNYPPLLRDAGIGGTAVVLYFIDESGRVLRSQLASSSGYPALDDAASSVAQVMRFTGQRGQVWVEVPISFGGTPVPLMRAREGVFQVPAIVVAGAPGAPAPRPVPQPLGEAQAVRAQAEAAAARAAATDAARPATTAAPAAPTFTPMTQRPELVNQSEVQRALVRNYPTELRDAGIGGSPVIWFFIDETGRVLRTQLSRSSGYPALDEAAAAVAQVMRFSPALNREKRVGVWIEIPIVFTAR
jgi:TonB family protein